LKYHAKDDIIASLSGEIEAARRCFLQANKTQNSVSQSSKPAEDKGKPVASTLDANLVKLDPRFTKEDLKEQKWEKKDPLNAKLLKPVPDGEFELVPFGSDLSKNFKIGKDLPELVKN
jgi:seryl-tRNA synthetase